MMAGGGDKDDGQDSSSESESSSSKKDVQDLGKKFELPKPPPQTPKPIPKTKNLEEDLTLATTFNDLGRS